MLLRFLEIPLGLATTAAEAPMSCARLSLQSSRGDVMGYSPGKPKHTFQSGLLQIIQGLENGSIVLAPGTTRPQRLRQPQLS